MFSSNERIRMRSRYSADCVCIRAMHMTAFKVKVSRGRGSSEPAAANLPTASVTKHATIYALLLLFFLSISCGPHTQSQLMILYNRN